jgi:hypothetical protein
MQCNRIVADTASQLANVPRVIDVDYLVLEHINTQHAALHSAWLLACDATFDKGW